MKPRIRRGPVTLRAPVITLPAVAQHGELFTVVHDAPQPVPIRVCLPSGQEIARVGPGRAMRFRARVLSPLPGTDETPLVLWTVARPELWPVVRSTSKEDPPS